MSQTAILTKEIGILRTQNEQLVAKVKLLSKFKSLTYDQQHIMRYLQGSHSENMRERANAMVVRFEDLIREKDEMYKEVRDEH